MNYNINSKYFEILSHPIRFAILQSLDIKMSNFTEILKDVDPNDEIGSSKLIFHLKKLVDFHIIHKEDKIYSLSELGLKLLTIIQNFALEEEGEFKTNINTYDDTKEEISVVIKDIDISRKSDFPVIKRPDNLPLIVSVFEYYEGKNFDFMEENFTLLLPDPISNDIKPKDWISNFSKSLYPLLNQEKSKEWLIDRYLKLGYGTRGLQDYGLMDASTSVPPHITVFEKLSELLTMRGKAGLFAKTGMGKSRTALYMASYWSRKFKTPILFIQNPNLLNEADITKLESVLREKGAKSRNDPKLLLIIEDAHLAEDSQLEFLKKIIAEANNKTYSVFVSFTDIQTLVESSKMLNSNYDQIEYLKKELIPFEYAEILDLEHQWDLLKPYFLEWLKWVAADVLFDLLPKSPIREETDIFHSPWSFVVSLGFLQNTLKELQSNNMDNNLSLILYYSLAQIYIMRGERGVNLTNLVLMFRNYFGQELEESIGKEWEKYFINKLNSWILPDCRLLPPFQQVQNEKTLTRETQINFYHIEWAFKVCEILDKANCDNDINFNNLFENLFPVSFEVWNYISQNNEDSESFLPWLRESVKFDINNEGEIRLTSFKVKPEYVKTIKSFALKNEKIKNFKQPELVNWLFIKSVISL